MILMETPTRLLIRKIEIWSGSFHTFLGSESTFISGHIFADKLKGFVKAIENDR